MNTWWGDFVPAAEWSGRGRFWKPGGNSWPQAGSSHVGSGEGRDLWAGGKEGGGPGCPWDPQVLSADTLAWIQEAFFSSPGPREEVRFLRSMLPEGETGPRTQAPWGWTSCVQTGPVQRPQPGQ